MAAPTVAAIPEAPASASAARHESTEDETREKERLREGQEKKDTEKEKRREGREERDSAKGRRRDHRTSKIGRRRKRRAEKREGRKEGRTRASRRSGRRTHRSQAGQARNLSLSPSFSFDPRPRFLRAPRASQPLFLFLFHPRAQPSPHHSPRAATRTPFALFSPPRTAAHHLLPRPHPPFLASLPCAASSRPSRRYYALAPARQRQITLHFQSPKELQRPTPPLSRSPLCHLRPRSSSTSFHGTHLLRRPTILTPLSSSLPRPPPTNSSGLRDSAM